MLNASLNDSIILYDDVDANELAVEGTDKEESVFCIVEVNIDPRS